MIEVKSEILEEVAFVRIVAVAQYALSFEVRAIVLQLVLDELEVRVEFVLLVPRRIMQIAISGHLSDSLLLCPYRGYYTKNNAIHRKLS